ncbi:hypothetical protein DOE76_09600 [Leifsonia sp. ku-ls]|jgi:hypothetical protein|nr:hypothetical protein DOE76_09600 [Leifsonia sp. ku-ls]
MDRSATGLPLIAAHTEVYRSRRTGERITVRCDCPLGRDHTYGEWVEATPESELRWSRALLWKSAREA